MREVNFSIPNVNKASVHITTTLYDRRALDCTSTLPLINSLNHLAYLTTSSARIRDILTVDGGVERLVCILKEGRSKDEMHMWKWNLAFQCIVNIGVRGSENVRTRVVEADMVPVIATILYDYIMVIEKEKAKAEAETAKSSKHCSSTKHSKMSRDMLSDAPTRSSFLEHLHATAETRQARRQAPPPSLDLGQSDTTAAGASTGPAATTLTSPPERTSFDRPPPPPHNRSYDGRPRSHRSASLNPPATSVPAAEIGSFGIRPVRDVDRLPSMIPALQSGTVSNPESPTTPLPPTRASSSRRPRRPSIRHQTSTTAEDEDAAMEDVAATTEAHAVDESGEPIAHSRSGSRDVSPQGEPADDDVDTALRLEIPAADEVDNVDIAQQTPTVATVLNDIRGQERDSNRTSPLPNAPANTASPAVPLAAYPNMFLQNAGGRAGPIPLMPRDEDVLMGLQLLAYISKYCYLRHYFQQTHLVPRLRIDKEVERSYGPAGDESPISEPEDDELEEFLQADDYNIFPLVEKFTVRCHSKDMQYWACVVMRNLCRKDDLRGGIRQCANYLCGKWEEYPRQFAKCRRCRRTKYCSKVN